MAAEGPTKTPTGITLHHEHLDLVVKRVDDLTDKAGNEPSEPPQHHIHAPATKPEKAHHGWLDSFIPQSARENFEAAWHMGNYVIDRSTGQKSFEEMSVYVRLGMHLLYYGSEQEKVLHMPRVLALLKDQSVKMGRQYDAPESKAHIQPFIESFHLQDSMKDMVKEDPNDYATFNDFFAREIKPSARPPAEPENSNVISSPADCRLTAFPTIDLATKIWIKGFGFSLERLLGSPDLAAEFDGGAIVIARLAPQDYHRWHSPIDGTVVSITEIPGTYYTVNPQAINESGTLDVFCENRRSVMVLKRPNTGNPVILVAVGAMLVGSINYNPGVEVGAEVKRAQCLGSFRYGGSTVIALFPKGEIGLDQDLVANSTEQKCETLVQVGWRIGEGKTA